MSMESKSENLAVGEQKSDDSGEEPPRKRARVGGIDIPTNKQASLPSLTKGISPPPSRSRGSSSHNIASIRSGATISSPFQLTRIEDLPAAQNLDTVTLKDILGNPVISECWEFNYLHDIDFLMSHFDEDIRHLVKVHVVHGFWKQEEAAGIKKQAERHKNVTLHTPYMPEMFGTHHTKMIVLFRHDDLAQIIIHTANLIERDWRNMTQAVWRSPLLPKTSASVATSLAPEIGSGARFKVDFVNYLRAYDTKRENCKPLIEQLETYDFSQIVGALVGSVPGRHYMESEAITKWGWQALERVLKHVPSQVGDFPEVVAQVSSIATLGGMDTWLRKTLFNTLGTTNSATSKAPDFKVIFPTPDEIRRSLDGYQSGHSIHTKIQSAAQAKQLQYLKPIFYHWAGDGDQHPSGRAQVLDAGRKRAAPHIKTYIRFSDSAKTRIDWALVTSANISKQAWGEARNSAGEVRIASFELGVLVWPGLFGDDAVIEPTFMRDDPHRSNTRDPERSKTIVGFRMPYDIPLVKYTSADEPWCATASYTEPDWMGNKWRA